MKTSSCLQIQACHVLSTALFLWQVDCVLLLPPRGCCVLFFHVLLLLCGFTFVWFYFCVVCLLCGFSLVWFYFCVVFFCVVSLLCVFSLGGFTFLWLPSGYCSPRCVSSPSSGRKRILWNTDFHRWWDFALSLPPSLCSFCWSSSTLVVSCSAMLVTWRVCLTFVFQKLSLE